MKTKVQFDEEIQELRERLKGEEIFKQNPTDFLSKVYVPAEASAVKVRSNLKKIYELHRHNYNPEQLAKELNWETIKMAYEYTDVYLKSIRKLNAKYKTSLIAKVREVLYAKAQSMDYEYLRKIDSVRHEVLMPSFLTKDFRDKGWFIHYDERCKNNGYFYLLKKSSFTLKKFCGSTGFMSTLPKEHQKTVKCLLGFLVRYNANNKSIDQIVAYEENMSNLQTFHTNDGRVCLGEVAQLITIANSAIKSDEFAKFDQIIIDIEELLTIINMNSPFTPRSNLLSVRTYIQQKLRENDSSTPDSEADAEDEDMCHACGETISECDCGEEH